MKYFCGLIAALILASSVYSGELVRNTIIKEVANTNSGGKDFAILISGGTWTTTSTTCHVNKAITFPRAAFGSDQTYNQAFTIALTAMTTGQTVRIHNFNNDSCHEANFISVSK